MCLINHLKIDNVDQHSKSFLDLWVCYHQVIYSRKKIIFLNLFRNRSFRLGLIRTLRNRLKNLHSRIDQSFITEIISQI